MNFLIERINYCVTLVELEILEWEVKEANDENILKAFNKKKAELTVR
jgi:hypothetical protein